MRPDSELQQDVMAELGSEPNLDDREVGANVSGGLVTLTGRVKSAREKLAAIRAVERVTDVRGIASELIVAPPAALEHRDVVVRPSANAEQVRATIAAALVRSAAVQAEQITVGAVDGRVTLGGRVHSWAERREAERAAWAAPGVTAVANYLVVAT